MNKWVIEINIGNGWERVSGVPSFKEEEDAWDVVYDNDWAGEIRVIEIIEEDY